MKVLLAYFLITTFVSWSEMSDLKGNSCSKFDRCSTKSAFKTCSCDADCYLYGTCCQDKIKQSRDDGSVGDFQCYSRRSLHPVFVKRACSKDFKGHLATKHACVEDDEDETDMKNNLLVTSRVTNITYYNKHCAFCNIEPAGQLEFWNIVVHCLSHKDVDENLVRRNLRFDQDKRMWGLEVENQFLQCTVGYVPPSNAVEAKPCSPGVIMNCPEGYENKDISGKCSRYYAERKLKYTGRYFRNIHCAVCNDANIKDLECPGMPKIDDDVEDSDFHDMIEVVFKNGEWLEKPPGKRYECSKGYAYDPGREKCRRFEENQIIVSSELISNSSPVYKTITWTLLAVSVILLL